MKKPLFLTVSMNPTLQKTLVFSNIYTDTVNRTNEYRMDTAGKGLSVCRVLSQLGRNSCHLTQLGGSLRPLFLDLCKQDKIKVKWVKNTSDIRLCYTLINKCDNSVTELVEVPEKVDITTEGRLLDAFSSLVQKCTTLIISGTKAPGFSDALIPEMVRQGQIAGCRTILDIHGKDLVNSLPFKPDIIKPNLFEFVSTFMPRLVLKNGLPDKSEIKEIVESVWVKLYDQFDCALILTHGADSIWYSDEDKLFEFVIKPVEPINTTGSGDAFTAGLASALEDGASLVNAIEAGARCGAINASLLRPGVTSIDEK